MQKRIGVLRGGTGKNYNESLTKGGDILSHITGFLGHKYKPYDIFIDKEGAWHLGGLPIKPSDLMHRVDMVWNIAQANLSHSLESFGIPHMSPGPFLSSLSENRELLHKHLQAVNIRLPRAIVLPVYQKDFDGDLSTYVMRKAKEIHAKFGAPWIVKSFTEDKNMGIHLAKTFPELVEAIEDGVRHEKSIAVEEFIAGKPAALHSVEGFRGEDVYVLPHAGPSQFSSSEKEKLYMLAKDLHRHLDAGNYLKTNVLLTPRGKIYILEFENVPDLEPGSLFEQACEHAGTNMHSVVEHMLERTLIK